jgi:hypothetical protein
LRDLFITGPSEKTHEQLPQPGIGVKPKKHPG